MTNYESNLTAWLDETEDAPGLFTSDNSPIVVSRSPYSDADAWTKHNTFQFAYGSQWFWSMPYDPVCTAGQPYNWWYYTYINNGSC